MRQRFTFKRVQLLTYEFDTPDGVSMATAHGWANGKLFETPGFQAPITNDLSAWTVVRAEPEHCADKCARAQVAKPARSARKRSRR